MSDTVVPADLLYAESHEWIRTEGDIVAIGITDHAQHELGDIVFVELPEVGQKIEPGKGFAVIEAVKTVADVYSPAAGEVVAFKRLGVGELPVDRPKLVAEFGEALLQKDRKRFAAVGQHLACGGKARVP